MDGQNAFAERVRQAIESDLVDAQYDMVQRQAAYSTALEQLIERYPLHRPVLAATKAAYMSCFDTLRELRQADELVHSKAREQGSATANTFLYRRRNEELSEALKTLRKNNQTLQERLEKLRVHKTETEQRVKFLRDGGIDKPDDEMQLVDGVPRNVRLGKLTRMFTIEQLSDPEFLSNKLKQLKERISELNEAKSSQKYVEKSEVERARARLQENLDRRDLLIDEDYKLYHKLTRLRCVFQALQEAGKQGVPIGDYTLTQCAALAQSQSKSLGMATHFDVVNAILHNSQLLRDSATVDTEKKQSTEVLCHADGSIDDQLSESTERILEYIDQFNLLMKQQEFWRAALHAASSPKGVLKNVSTLRLFESASTEKRAVAAESAADSELPVMQYVEAVLNDSFASQCDQTDVAMQQFAAECIRAALRYGRADLAMLSVRDACVPHCLPVADALFNHAKELHIALQREQALQSVRKDKRASVQEVSAFENELLELAFRVYCSPTVAASSKALECLVDSRRFQYAIEFAQEHNLEDNLRQLALRRDVPDLEFCLLLLRNQSVDAEECVKQLVGRWTRPDLAVDVLNALFKSSGRDLRSAWMSLAQTGGLQLAVLQRLQKCDAFRSLVSRGDQDYECNFTAAAVVQQSVRAACEQVADELLIRTASSSATSESSESIHWELFKRLSSIRAAQP